MDLREQLFCVVGDRYEAEQTFTIEWFFTDSNRGLNSTSFDELMLDQLYEEAYPSLGEPLASLVNRYLEASETVLVLQGGLESDEFSSSSSPARTTRSSSRMRIICCSRSNGNRDLHRFLRSQTASCGRKAARSSSPRTWPT